MGGSEEEEEEEREKEGEEEEEGGGGGVGDRQNCLKPLQGLELLVLVLKGQFHIISNML